MPFKSNLRLCGGAEIPMRYTGDGEACRRRLPGSISQRERKSRPDRRRSRRPDPHPKERLRFTGCFSTSRLPRPALRKA